MAAFNGVGFSNTIDPILGRKQGAFTPPNSVDLEKKRSYSASAYYSAEIEKRPNLDLLTETFVNKVLLQSSDNGIVEAKGVQICSKDGSVDEIYADDEVLLAAGALQSPQLLENSGIGSKEILQRYGVEVLIDNPGVGENLQDHCFASISFEIADDQISADVVRDPAVIEALLKQYEDTRTGPLSGVPFSLAYLPPVDFNGRMTLKDLKSLIETHLDLKDPSLSPAMIAQFAELQSMMLDPSESTCYYGLGPAQMHIRLQGKTSMSQAYRQQLPENFITIMVGLNHPLSRGSVHIGSSDPKSSPLIDPCYLSHPLDMEILARGIQFIDKIVNQQAMKQMLKTNNRIPPLAANLADLEDAKQVVKDRLWTTYHSSCTCAMMPQEIGGVVNDRLVVHGTKNLRVIDASIFPMITLGNIQATVYAVAERASDLIKEDWAKGGPIPKI
jgi:choline dehydrogenase-like flavoprotein